MIYGYTKFYSECKDVLLMSITMITVCTQGHEHKQLFLSLDR